MCDVLDIPRSTYYYQMSLRENDVQQQQEQELMAAIENIFKASRNNYGTRKIKVELKKQGLIVSRRKIGRIMKRLGLVSNYTVAQFKRHRSTCNEAPISNTVIITVIIKVINSSIAVIITVYTKKTLIHLLLFLPVPE